MTQFKVTANHKTEHIRIALCASADDVSAKAESLKAAGYWENIEVVPFVPTVRTARRVAL